MTYKIRILFIEAVKFSYDALNTLIKNNFSVVGLITKKKSSFNSDFADLAEISRLNKIPVCYKEKNNEL